MIYTGLLSLLLAEYAANQKCSTVLLCSADSIYPNSTENRSARSIHSTLVDSVDRLDSDEYRLTWSTPSTCFPLFIGHSFFAAQLQLSSVFFIVMSVCLSQPCTVLMVTRQLADMPTLEITWSLCKNDWTDRVASWRVDWPRPVSFCVRWVSHPKLAVRDVSWRRSLLVIKYFAALYLANGSSGLIVKIEHYTVLRHQRRIVKELLQVGLPRVLEYSRVLGSKKYSSNVLVLEYSFNSTSGRKFQFPVPVFQINKQLLQLYAILAPLPLSCELRALRLNSLEIALQPILGYSFLTYCYWVP